MEIILRLFEKLHMSENIESRSYRWKDTSEKCIFPLE